MTSRHEDEVRSGAPVGRHHTRALPEHAKFLVAHAGRERARAGPPADRGLELKTARRRVEPEPRAQRDGGANLPKPLRDHPGELFEVGSLLRVVLGGRAKRIERELDVALRGVERLEVRRVAGRHETALCVLGVNGSGDDAVEAGDVAVGARDRLLAADHARDTEPRHQANERQQAERGTRAEAQFLDRRERHGRELLERNRPVCKDASRVDA